MIISINVLVPLINSKKLSGTFFKELFDVNSKSEYENGILCNMNVNFLLLCLMDQIFCSNMNLIFHMIYFLFEKIILRW